MKIDWRKELNDTQFDAVSDTDGPMMVIAGAGSGKTRVLTYRVAYLIAEKKIDPESIMAVTFTNKAANEMLERIIDLVGRRRFHSWIGTFHRTCANILRNYGDRSGFLNRFTVFDESEQIAMIKRAMKKIGTTPKEYSPDAILGRISRAKSYLIDPRAFEDSVTNQMEELTSKIYKIYQEGLRDQKGYDFDDLIMEAWRLLKSYPDVRKSLHRQYGYICIDEFQDINHAQYEFIKLVVEPVKKNVFAVGDDDQSIYGFRAADAKFIEQFLHDFAPVKLKKLEQNYRSTQHILKLANEVIRQKSWGILKTLWTQIEGGETPRYFLGESDVDEAYFIARLIQEMLDEGHSRNEFAVLYRTNAQSRTFEEVFGRLGIPFKIVGGQAFYQRMEIKDVLCYFRVLINDHDLQALDRILNSPKRGLGDKSKDEILHLLEKYKIGFYEFIEAENSEIHNELSSAIQRKLEPFARIMLELKEQSTKLDLDKLLDWLLENTGYEQALKAQDSIEAEARIDNLNELRGAIATFCEEYPGEGLDKYLEGVSLTTRSDTYDANAESVTLMTLHNAKGLEFKHVFLSGLEEGLLPHFRSISSGETEEERRLFYVGVTRARESLHITGARTRRLYGQLRESKHSRFLDSIPRECIEGLEVLDDASFFRLREESEPERKKPSSRSRRSGDDFYGEESSMPSDEEKAITRRIPKPKREKVEQKVPSKYTVGDIVFHKTFGEGEIEEISPMGDDNFLTICFAKSGRRILSENSAPLSSSKPDDI